MCTNVSALACMWHLCTSTTCFGERPYSPKCLMWVTWAAAQHEYTTEERLFQWRTVLVLHSNSSLMYTSITCRSEPSVSATPPPWEMCHIDAEKQVKHSVCAAKWDNCSVLAIKTPPRWPSRCPPLGRRSLQPALGVTSRVAAALRRCCWWWTGPPGPRLRNH